MAKAYQGILGPVVGKLGTTVGYLWRGKPILRTYVPHIHYPNTPLQQAERDWFVSMVRFAVTVRPAITLGLRQAADRAAMSQANWFVKNNKQHFLRQPDGSLEVNYPHLALSQGPLAPVAPLEASVSQDTTLTVRFDPCRQMARSRGGDSVHLLIYNATLHTALAAQPVARRAAAVALRLPDGWQHHRLHCYLFAVDNRGNASPSAHIEPLDDIQASDNQYEYATGEPKCPPKRQKMQECVPQMPVLNPELPPG